MTTFNLSNQTKSRRLRPSILLLCTASLLPLGITFAHEADDHRNLGEVLRDSGWNRLIGIWVDADTNGAKIKSTYSWRFKDRVVEITTRDTEKESVSLMGRNPKSGEIFHMSAGSAGDSSIGKWRFEKIEAILSLLFVTGNGQEGALQIRHKLQGNDTMFITVDLPEPITFKMIRVKNPNLN